MLTPRSSSAAFRESGNAYRLTVISDGRHALEHLFGLRDDGIAANQPDLILLDLNLPGLNGCQVLTQIKNDPYLRLTPVVVLTTSHREEDILETYMAGANTYIVKPAEYPSYRELVATLRQYWMNTALRVPGHLRRGLASDA